MYTRIYLLKRQGLISKDQPEAQDDCDRDRDRDPLSYLQAPCAGITATCHHTRFSVALMSKPRVACMLGKHSVTKLRPQPNKLIFYRWYIYMVENRCGISLLATLSHRR